MHKNSVKGGHNVFITEQSRRWIDNTFFWLFNVKSCDIRLWIIIHVGTENLKGQLLRILINQLELQNKLTWFCRKRERKEAPYSIRADNITQSQISRSADLGSGSHCPYNLFSWWSKWGKNDARSAVQLRHFMNIRHLVNITQIRTFSSAALIPTPFRNNYLGCSLKYGFAVKLLRSWQFAKQIRKY